MKILYPILYSALLLISLLPMRALYWVSDLLHFLLFSIGRYRRDVVTQNLSRSFPAYSPDQIRTIQKNFQRYFCDMIVEVIKLLSIRPNQLRKRVRYTNYEVFRPYYEVHQSLILVLGHQGNWEMMGAAFAPLPYHQLYIIYRPLKSPIFDKLLSHLRSHLGNQLYTMKSSLKGMLRNQHLTTATAFVADQSPPPEHAYWTRFLHQDTPVFLGVEKIAKKLNYPVFYMSICMPSRGYYEVEAKIVTKDPRNCPSGRITERYLQMLEKDIENQPEIWLWTHRRWKHTRPTD